MCKIPRRSDLKEGDYDIIMYMTQTRAYNRCGYSSAVGLLSLSIYIYIIPAVP
jgi:hypothetical protein